MRHIFVNSEASKIENGFKPSSFQKLLARLSGGGGDRTILTSLSSSGRSIGTIGETFKNPESSAAKSFSPRILSTVQDPPFDPFTASDNSFLARPVNEIDDIKTKGRVIFEAPVLSPSVAPAVLSPANQVENEVKSVEDESLPISTVIPAIIAAMQDQTTSEEQRSSLKSLLSDMVKSARQQVEPAVPGGVDFSQARRTPDGRLCVIKEETIETLAKESVLECVHNNIEKCHYTYITQFDPTQEEECSENFEKLCSITFRFVISNMYVHMSGWSRQEGGGQEHSTEVLQTTEESLRWRGTSTMQDCFRVRLHHQGLIWECFHDIFIALSVAVC